MLEPKTGCVVILPSLTLRADYLAQVPGIADYEERMLFYILALGSPDLSVIYLSSRPPSPALVAYYLSFLPNPSSAAQRLHLISPEARSGLPLTQQILREPETLAKIRDLIASQNGPSYIVPFNVTPIEEELSRYLGLGLYGPPSGAVALGDKSSGRELAESCGVPTIPGCGGLRRRADIENAMRELMNRSGADTFVLKVNDSHAGFGNVLLTLPASGEVSLSTCKATFPVRGQTWDATLEAVRERGAVLEVLLPTTGLCSPSVAVSILPSGRVSVVGTHDQILSGPLNQTYWGCTHPARESYRSVIEGYASSLGAALAERHVRGLIGIDFVVSNADSPKAKTYFCEFNLRLGGTTHPLGIAIQLAGLRNQPPGDTGCYSATDRLESPALRERPPELIIDRLTTSGLGYSPVTGQGAILHLVRSAGSAGKIGVTCLGKDRDDALRRMDEVHALFGAQPW